MPSRFSRFDLVTRVAAFFAIGVLGVSFAAVFAFAYLALPVFAAVRLQRDATAYLDDDAPRILSALHWLAAICAWVGLTADHLPARQPDEIVMLDVEPLFDPPAPLPVLWRVIKGLPSAIALTLVCWLGVVVWVWAAIEILIARRVGVHTFEYLVGLQRWSMRLLVYQAGLVDRYPPFSFDDMPAALSRAGYAEG